jgi:hypothetical protein
MSKIKANAVSADPRPKAPRKGACSAWTRSSTRLKDVTRLRRFTRGGKLLPPGWRHLRQAPAAAVHRDQRGTHDRPDALFHGLGIKSASHLLMQSSRKTRSRFPELLLRKSCALWHAADFARCR